jgi:hypothetical protein
MHANVNRSQNINRNVNVNRNVAVNRNPNRKCVDRNGGWGYWRNGVSVVAALVAGAIYAASCSYEYGQQLLA